MSDRGWPTRRSRLVGAVAAWTGALDDAESDDARDSGEGASGGGRDGA